MRGLIAAAALLLALAAVSSQPIYDESKVLICPNLFPNSKTYANSRLNETLHHLTGDYFGIRDAIDAQLDTVVKAEAAACLKIMGLIASVTAAPPPAVTT